MTIPTIDEISDKVGMVTFVRMTEGKMFYVTEDGLEFPVPIGELGKMTIWNSEPHFIFARHIHKHLKDIESGQAIRNMHVGQH